MEASRNPTAYITSVSTSTPRSMFPLRSDSVARSAAQLQPVGLGSTRARGQIDLGRFAASSGVGQCVAQAFAQPPRLLVAARHAEGNLVHPCSQVECQGGLGRPRRLQRGRSSAFTFARGQPVFDQRVGVARRVALERQGNAAVIFAPQQVGQEVHHRLANAVVVGLDRVAAPAAARADEVLRVEHGERRHRGTIQITGGLENLLRGRAAGDTDDAQELAGIGRQLRDANAEHLVDRRRPRPVQHIGRGVLRIPHQLGDQHRVPAGFGRELDERLAVCARLVQAGHQLPRLGVGQRQQLDVSGVRELVGVGCEQALEQRAAPHFLDPVGGEEQEWRRVLWTHELGQQWSAVGVAPVQVVDEQNQSSRTRDPGQQLAQRRKGAPPDLVRISGYDAELGPAGLGDRLDPFQRREQPRECLDVAGQEGFYLAVAEAGQVVADSVHQAVDCLVVQGLARVAASAEDEQLWLLLRLVRKCRTSSLLPMPDGPWT